MTVYEMTQLTPCRWATSWCYLQDATIQKRSSHQLMLPSRCNYTDEVKSPDCPFHELSPYNAVVPIPQSLQGDWQSMILTKTYPIQWVTPCDIYTCPFFFNGDVSLNVHTCTKLHVDDNAHGLDWGERWEEEGIKGEEIKNSYVPTSYFHLAKQEVKTYTEMAIHVHVQSCTQCR